MIKTKQRVSAVVILLLIGAWITPAPKAAHSAGLSPTIVLSNEAVNTASAVSVAFPVTGLVNTNKISIYLGGFTGGSAWQLNSVTTADISCSDDGTGEAYAVDSVTAASATMPMWTQITATTVGAGAGVVTCIIGDGTPNPINPTAAGSYSISVVTTNDTGAGIAYVGNANDVAVSATVLPNLTLVIDAADGTKCATTSGVTACNLGVLTTAAVNTGNYDVNVGTNSLSGATLRVNDDGNLRNGANDIDDVVDGNLVTAGTEGYGIGIAATGYTEAGIFATDDSPITASPVTVATSTGPLDPATSGVTVTHRATVSTITNAQTYSHLVTWTATATF